MEGVDCGVEEAADPQDYESGAGQFHPAFLPRIKGGGYNTKSLGQPEGDGKVDDCNQEFLTDMVFE